MARTLSTIVLCVLLAACGTKGPLYLPPQDGQADLRIPAPIPPAPTTATPERRPVPAESAPAPK